MYAAARRACDPSVLELLNPVDGTDGVEDPDGDGLSSLREYQLLMIEDDRVISEATNPCDRKAYSVDCCRSHRLCVDGRTTSTLSSEYTPNGRLSY